MSNMHMAWLRNDEVDTRHISLSQRTCQNDNYVLLYAASINILHMCSGVSTWQSKL